MLQNDVTDSENTGPLHLCRHVKYPPVCQIIGSEDSLFDLSHVIRLAEALDEQGIAHQEFVVYGADHAFDMMLSGKEEVFDKTFVPAVEWLSSLLAC